MNKSQLSCTAFLGLLLFVACLFTLDIASCTGADLNGTIVQGDISFYQDLLKRIGSSKSKDDDLVMQELLVKKIINLLKTRKDMKIVLSPPRNKDEYANLFLRFVEWSWQKSELLQDIREAEKELKILKRQIALSKRDDRSLPTLELQYAFYKKGQAIYREKIKGLQEAMKQAPTLFVDALKDVSFDLQEIRSQMKSLDDSLNKIEIAIYKQKIERDRLNLLGRQTEAQKAASAIDGLKLKRQDLLKEKLKWLFLKYSFYLKRKEKKVFSVGNSLLDLADTIKEGDALRVDMSVLLQSMDRSVLGTARTLHGLTAQEFGDLLKKFWHGVNAPFFVINDTPVSILKLLISFFIFATGFWVGQFYKKNIHKLSIKNRTLTASTLTLLSNLGYYAIIFVGFFFALNVLGINLSSIALIAGALSVGIGFGLQNVVANFVSGIILLFERSIKIGDFIELDQNLRGRVRDIRMRSVTINTNSNIDVIVPNQDLIQNRVVNWTMNDDIRRFEIPFGVAYGTNPEQVMKVVLAAVEKSGIREIYTSPRRNTRIIMTGMGDSSIDFMLLVWLKGPRILSPRRTTSKFLVLIYSALYESGIEIPFPQRDLHIRSIDEEAAKRLKGEKTPAEAGVEDRKEDEAK